MDTNLITKAIDIVGLQKLAVACGVSHQAVRKWERQGRLPRTEWTGETDYSAKIETATDGVVKKSDLLVIKHIRINPSRLKDPLARVSPVS